MASKSPFSISLHWLLLNWKQNIQPRKEFESSPIALWALRDAELAPLHPKVHHQAIVLGCENNNLGFP